MLPLQMQNPIWGKLWQESQETFTMSLGYNLFSLLTIEIALQITVSGQALYLGTQSPTTRACFINTC
jgi:hypothetical protein